MVNPLLDSLLQIENMILKLSERKTRRTKEQPLNGTGNDFNQQQTAENNRGLYLKF